jgi:hypothetical protein
VEATRLIPWLVLSSRGGNYTLFSSALAGSSLNGQANFKIIPTFFSPAEVNVNGWAIGSTFNQGGFPSYQNLLLWNGTAPTPTLLGGTAPTPASGLIATNNLTVVGDINDENQVAYGVANTGYGFSAQETCTLWESPTAQTDIRAQMSPFLQWQITQLLPLSLSNQKTPAPNANPDASIQILASDHDMLSPAYMLFTRNNSGAWAYAKVALPTGTEISEWSSINSSGVIAAIGTTTSVSTEQHALLLLPVDITVKKSGQPVPLPPNGVLVEVGDSLDIALAPSWYNVANQFTNAITWQWRELVGNGSFGAWIPFGSYGVGTEFTDTALCLLPGIYQIQAVINTGNNQTQTFGYVRERDDPYGADSHGTYNNVYRAGMPTCVGVAEGAAQVNIVNTARQALGSTAWGITSSITLPTGFLAGVGSDKCNIFNYQEVTAAGSSDPVDGYGAPPRAYDLWNSNFPMAGWTCQSELWYPSPGAQGSRYVLQWLGFRFPGTHAHCGIVDYDGGWINAGSVNVNRYPNLTDSAYQTAHFRSN